jgi:hypothetical protein
MTSFFEIPQFGQLIPLLGALGSLNWMLIMHVEEYVSAVFAQKGDPTRTLRRCCGERRSGSPAGVKPSTKTDCSMNQISVAEHQGNLTATRPFGIPNQNPRMVDPP